MVALPRRMFAAICEITRSDTEWLRLSYYASRASSAEADIGGVDQFSRSHANRRAKFESLSFEASNPNSIGNALLAF